MKKKYMLIACTVMFSSYVLYNKDNINSNIVVKEKFVGIKGKVIDFKTGLSLSARIVVVDEYDQVVDSYYKYLPGIFTNDDGTFQLSLKPGSYSLTAFHGPDYQSEKCPFTVSTDSGFYAEIHLKPWSPLREFGWIDGDGHNHLDSDIKDDYDKIKMVRQISLAQGIDFVCSVQQWAGFNDTSWRSGFDKVSDSRFVLTYGAEMPKYRTGHTWWIGLMSTRGYFRNCIDNNYEQLYFQNPERTIWNFQTLKFPNIPDVDIVQRFKKADGAVAIVPHPTSWWWQKRGEISKYTTNASSYLSFGLLSGKIWDGFVVMGYMNDHYFYQNLWFHILNEGYRMPAISELDGGFEKVSDIYYGALRTYYQTNGQISSDRITNAIRKGRTFVTTGPIILANVDNQYSIGDIIRPIGEPRNLNIHVYASGEKEGTLSFVVVYRNGHVYKLWDIRDKKVRLFTETLRIDEKEKAWYVVKAYGNEAWSDTSYFNIMEVCNHKDAYPEFKEGQTKNDVAITSPFYFWPEGEKDPEVLQSNIDIEIKLKDKHHKLKNVGIEVLQNGDKIKSLMLTDGKGTFTMPVNSLLHIQCKGEPSICRSLYLDYEPHAKLIEELASGQWIQKYSSLQKFNGGEIPWEAFNFDETRRVLSVVHWKIDMVQNERDSLWNNFENLFKK